MNKLPDTGRFTEDPLSAYSLPGRYYFDPEIYKQEQEKIFYRTWQYVCHISRLESPGSFFVRDIGDQSVVVIRGKDSKIRAFHNVCQHRAHRLLEGNGSVSSAIVCPYHRWTYELTGELRQALHSEEVKDFPKSEICLSAVRAEPFCGFVFINLDPDAEPLMTDLGEFESEVLELSPLVGELKMGDERTIHLAANWKNSVENYSECYHCPNQHPSLAQGSLDMESYQITVHKKYHSHASRGVGDATGYKKAQDRDGEAREFGSWLLWPNWAVEVYPGGYLNVFYHLPTGPEETVQICEWYFPTSEPTKEQREVIDFINVVRDEDIPLCETVQRGLHSLGYSQGRLVINEACSYFSEHAVHDFQKRVLEHLS
tara:strand:- start:40 stop:1152 length:1113 start_codon:yes stop_codon:yes gene_type:complete